MTLPNYITFLRILLIPVFATFFLYYETGDGQGGHDETLRWWAVAAFIAAAISDGVDGWIARRFNMRSQLGAVLDPLADKGLLLTALIILAWAKVEPEWRLPLWFVVLVLTRDVLLLLGVAVLHLLVGKVEVKPSWTGKTATALQMVAISVAMVRPDFLLRFFPLIVDAAGAFVAISFFFYMRGALAVLSEGGHTHSAGKK